MERLYFYLFMKLLTNFTLYTYQRTKWEKDYMTNLELYKKLSFPDEVIGKLITYEENRTDDLPKTLVQRLLNRTQWEEAVEELKTYIGEDPDHINIFGHGGFQDKCLYWNLE